MVTGPALRSRAGRHLPCALAGGFCFLDGFDDTRGVAAVKPVEGPAEAFEEIPTMVVKGLALKVSLGDPCSAGKSVLSHLKHTKT